MLMDDCNAGTCISSATSPDGVASLMTCLDSGTHTFVVASNTTDPTGFMNVGLDCGWTCEDAETFGFPCIHCDTVDSKTTMWGDLKAQYR